MSFTLLNLQNTPHRPIENGDAGLVMTKEGGFYVFSTGEIDPANMTEIQIEQGRALQAFAVALRIPAVMGVLDRLANDPNIVNQDKVLDGGRPN